MNDINRFLKAQEYDYELALIEIKNGRKVNHWMWYIFPQIRGLGESNTSIYYGIRDLDEARDYLNHEILGTRLRKITEELLKLETNNSVEIFGIIDSMKLKSCMTLFDIISEKDNIYNKVLEKYFNGTKDELTISICDIKKQLKMVN